MLIILNSSTSISADFPNSIAVSKDINDTIFFTIDGVESKITLTPGISCERSRIKDADMAKGIMEHVKLKILTDVAQFLLDQANVQSKSVLQLLR